MATTGVQERRTIRQDTAGLLYQLGSDPHDVATRLEAAEVRGFPGDAARCAVAVYLSAVMTGDARIKSVEVGLGHVVVTRSSRWRRRVMVRLPPAVRAFIVQFDRNEYPRLVCRVMAEEGCSDAGQFSSQAP